MTPTDTEATKMSAPAKALATPVTGESATAQVVPEVGSRVCAMPKRITFLDQMWDGRVGRALTTLLIFTVVLAFLWGARETLTLFLFAVLFAYFLAPAVGRLQKPLRGRAQAILLVYLVGIGVLVGLGFLVGPSIGAESKDLTTTLPSLLDKFGSGQLVADFGRAHHLKPAVVAQMQTFVIDHKAQLLAYGRSFAASLAEPAQHIWWLVLIPILSIFFLKQGESIAAETVELGRAPAERGLIQGLLSEINVMLGSYIRAQIILAALTLTSYTVVLSVMRVPYSVILGPVGGFLEFIPVVGPAIGAILIFGISLLAGYHHLIFLFLFLGTWRVIQDYVSAPRIMGRSLEINPLLQIFSVLAGGEIGGVVGALISVPVAATVRIIGRHIRSQVQHEAVMSDSDG